MDAERQHENPLGVSVPTCHVQLSRTGLPGMVHLGHRYRQRPVEVQRLARTDTGSVRHEEPLSFLDRRHRADKHRPRMFLLYTTRPTDSGTHRPHPLLATQGRRHGRRPRLHTENRIKRRQKERQAEERSRSIHRLRLYGNRLSRTLRNYFIFHRKQRTRRNKKRYAFASLRLIFLMHSMPWNTFNQLISEQWAISAPRNTTCNK